MTTTQTIDLNQSTAQQQFPNLQQQSNLSTIDQAKQWTSKASSKLSQSLTYAKQKYDQYKKNKEQRLMKFPEPKVYPSKPHLMPVQNLRKLNFSQLSEQELKILDDLSTFTPHRQFVKMMVNRHSDMKKKQYFIKEHSSLLSSDQFADFNKAKFQYENNSRTFAAFCTGLLTFSGFMIGLWVLPARKSPWKYSLIGLGAGLGISYGFWRFQIFRYHNQMNQQFKVILKQKYENQKKSQKIKDLQKV